MSRTIEEWRKRKAHEEEAAYERLSAAISGGQVLVYTDPRLLDFSGSPVHRPWDHLLPLTVLMTLALLVLLLTGVVVGIIVTTVFVFAHLYGNRHFVAWRLRQRTIAQMVEDYAQFQTLWSLGGIALVMTGGAESPCLAPKGDWRKFVRRHLGEGGAGPEPLANAPVPVAAAAPAPPIFDVPVETPPEPAAPEVIIPSPQPGAHWTSVLEEEEAAPPHDEVRP